MTYLIPIANDKKSRGRPAHIKAGRTTLCVQAGFRKRMRMEKLQPAYADEDMEDRRVCRRCKIEQIRRERLARIAKADAAAAERQAERQSRRAARLAAFTPGGAPA